MSETFVWKRAETSGAPPSKRDSHTCSVWKNKLIVIGGLDLDGFYQSDVHVLDTGKWCQCIFCSLGSCNGEDILNKIFNHLF